MVIIFPNLSAWKISGKKQFGERFGTNSFMIQVRNVEEILPTNWYGEYSWWLNQPLLQFLGWKRKMFELPPTQVNIPLFLRLHFHLTTASVEFEGTIHRLRWKNPQFQLGHVLLFRTPSLPTLGFGGIRAPKNHTQNTFHLSRYDWKTRVHVQRWRIFISSLFLDSSAEPIHFLILHAQKMNSNDPAFHFPSPQNPWVLETPEVWSPQFWHQKVVIQLPVAVDSIHLIREKVAIP